VRSLRHRLGTTDETELSVAQNYLLRSAHDGLKAGAAQAIERERGSLLAASALERDVPREVDRVFRGVENVAEDRLVDVGRGNSRALDCRPGCMNRQIDRREILQLAAEGAEWSSDRGKEYDASGCCARGHYQPRLITLSFRS